jgi:para-aminobenzoate synthetase
MSYIYDWANDEVSSVSDDAIPFDYRGGYVGYLGYEVRYDCLDDGCRGNHCTIFEPKNTNGQVPSAAFFFVDRSLLYDHMLDDWYLIGITDRVNSENTISWIRSLSATLTTFVETIPAPESINKGNNAVPLREFTPNRSREQYLQDISRSHDEIRNGESYELCVTNQLTTELTMPRLATKKTHQSPLDLYKRLRRRNPAPFSSYFGMYPQYMSSGLYSGQVSICCSSPERFLSMRKAGNDEEFIIESKPIKGTAARYKSPGSHDKDQVNFAETIDLEIASRLRESVKDRAENLMIVDLLRNDFGRVCKVGTVHVPKLMDIESYATVHQMVSTVRGIVDGTITNAVDVIEACFPGGSMTGAPKYRTVEILDEIEQGVSRGPYSGCLGYISLNGCMDMNIIIRTAVLTPVEARGDSSEAWKVSIGCGGAITALSDSNDEYEEMLLKSRAVREAISEWAQSRQ